MIRIAFVLCHQFPDLVGVSMELHTQKEHSLILIHLYHLLHLSGKEHVAFVMLWAMIGGAAQTSDFLPLIHLVSLLLLSFVHFVFTPPPPKM